MENEYLKYYAQYAISTNLTKPDRLNQKNRQKAVFLALNNSQPNDSYKGRVISLLLYRKEALSNHQCSLVARNSTSG